MTTTATVASVLRKARLVLFDFDGPLCHVFAGVPAPTVARQLEQVAGTHFDTDDPLSVLEEVARTRPEILPMVEKALVAAERSAVAVSQPIMAGVDALRAAIASGRQVGIVTNNSKDAATDFLRMLDLDSQINLVVGRQNGRPDLMKPSPWPLIEALKCEGASPENSVFIGDSMSDIDAAAAANMPCVAFANKPGKRAMFENTSAVTIDNLVEVSKAFRVD